jgi:hypothetical protein
MSESVKLERATGVTVQPTPDGKHAAVVFRVPSGTAGAVVGPNDFSKIISQLIEGSAKVAAGPTDATNPLGKVEVIPLQVTTMGYAPGRTREEGYMAVRLGHVTLTFAVGLATLREFAQFVLSRTTAEEKPVSH